MQEASMVRPLPTSNPDQTFFHFDLVRALQLHRKLAVSIFVASVLLAAAYTVKTWHHYEAQGRVYVQPAPPRMLDNNPNNSRWPADANSYETYIQQQIQDVTRPDVLLAALRKLPQGSFRKSNETEQAAVERLGRWVEVARIGNSYEISITAKAHSAEMAATISNAVANSYIDSATHELRAGDVQRIELLREERDRVQKELASDRAEQEDLNQKLGVAAIGTSTPDPYDEQISAIRAELVKARTENDQAAARLTAMAGGKTSTVAIDAEADVLVAADPGMVSLKTSLNQRRSLLISQMANLTPSHPLYKQDADELAKINTSLEAMTKDLRAKAAAQIEQRLKNDLERTSSVEARLNAQLAQMTSAAGTATPRLQRSNDLAADILRLQNRYATVDEQFRNLVLENNAPGAVYLSNPAAPPLGPDHKTTFRIAAVLLIAGLIFGLGAALIAHNLDPRIYIAADVERVLGFTPMAQLPDLHEVNTGVAEEYMLRLAAAVEHARQDGALKSCIFTGVAPGAGATTVANRVRGMLEAMGRQTVLVDATGSSSAALPSESSASAGLVHLPRGSRSTALLQQMTEGTGEKSIVVSDTAPLLVSGETEYMARFVDAAIVVIESGVTTKTQLREAARTLQRLNVAAAGFVLNRISREKADPAFLRSLRAVEEHIEFQTRAIARRETWIRPGRKEAASDFAVAEPPKITEPVAPPPQVPEPVTATAPQAPKAPAPEPVASSDPAPAKVQAAEPIIAPASEPVSARAAEPIPTPEPVRTPEPLAAAVSKPPAPPTPAPTSTRLITPAPEPVQTPVAEPRPAPAAASSPVSPVQPRVMADPAPMPASPTEWTQLVREPQEPTLTSRPLPGRGAAPPVEAPRVAAAPPQSWSAPPVSAAAPAPPPPIYRSPEPAPKPAAAQWAPPPKPAPQQVPPAAEIVEEDPYDPASRLSGLRNLLVSLGLNSVQREPEQASPAPQPEKIQERAVFSEGFAPFGAAPRAPVPNVVTAPPEILPPRPPAPEKVEREEEPVRPAAQTPPPREREDSFDDVVTLPSKRGQYQKKR
jgi:uncharacterized protein involved in exopolysaccharide biosynthesis